MSLNGNLHDFELTEVLQLLSRGQHTGLLTVSVQRETEHGEAVPTIAKIYFHAGKVAFATSGYRHRLGHRLIDRGLLSREAIRSLLDRQREGQSRLPLGWLLVEGNVLCSETVVQELRAQVLHVLESAIAWRNGTFNFEKQAVSVEESPFADPALSVEHLLLEIHRQHDEGVLAAATACLRAPEAINSPV